ncbi:porin [Massilia forsythiae]|uniref:Porin n=1 Tax=Massilia forsythiae TaxID=2728020 RepID=A0A7Z2VZI7_9BURK|nr:porin [Massilia forsythiae]QJE02326.1 porin [Massilia forsythiae]
MQQTIFGRCSASTFLALGIAGAAHAQDMSTAAAMPDGAPRTWSISGFGTFGAARSSERQADYTTTILKPNGTGVSRAWSTDFDTRAGVQLDVNLDRRWSAVVQLVSEQRLDNSYRPQVEWANVKYQATPELALRFGRIALPMFLTADYRKVGYAYPWVRPPVEGYSSLPVFASDGVDATLRWNLGDVHNAAQVLFGRNKPPLVAPYRAVARSLFGMSNTSDWGAFNLRINYIRANLTTNVGEELFDALAAFGPAGQALARRYAADHKIVSMANVGVNYDPGNWFLTAEAGGTRTQSFLGRTRNAYVSAGWRWHALTPYATYSRVRAAGATSERGLPLDGLPPAYAVPAAYLNGALNGLLSTIPQQTSASAGLRWDLRANMALKFEYDRVKPVDGSRGTLLNPTPDFRSDRPFHVASVTLDYVY